MSFIVIWLHFFLQGGNPGEALTTQIQNLTADHTDKTDLQGSEKCWILTPSAVLL
jgi:hypothetical protein